MRHHVAFRAFVAGAFAALITLSILLPLPLHAHPMGTSFEAVSNDLFIDIGYAPVDFTAGEYALFDFLLQTNNEALENIPYDHVWVRILMGNETLLATGVAHQVFGPTTFLYSFREGGSYTLDVSYRDRDGKEIAAAAFPIQVASVETRSITLYVVSFVMFALGFIVAAVVYRRRQAAHASTT